MRIAKYLQSIGEKIKIRLGTPAVNNFPFVENEKDRRKRGWGKVKVENLSLSVYSLFIGKHYTESEIIDNALYK